MAAKPFWATIDCSSFEKFIKEDLNASVFLSGAAMRIRAENSGFAYGNAIKGSEAFMDPELPRAPEMNIPDTLKSAAHFQVTCPADVQQIYTKIWTEVTK